MGRKSLPTDEFNLTERERRMLDFMKQTAAEKGYPPTVREICEKLGVKSTSTVHKDLASLEKKGFIELRSDETDRRCKRIYLLAKGKDCNKSIYDTICNTENQLTAGFTDEEKEQFFAYLNRAIENMGASPCKPKHKEEPQA